MERYEFGFSTSIDDKSSIESQYQKMEIDREIYLERARESAELTIPYLYPPAGSNQATTYPTPYQAIGARGTVYRTIHPGKTGEVQVEYQGALRTESAVAKDETLKLETGKFVEVVDVITEKIS